MMFSCTAVSNSCVFRITLFFVKIHFGSSNNSRSKSESCIFEFILILDFRLRILSNSANLESAIVNLKIRRLVKKLDILITKAFVGPFLATFVVTLLVLLMQFFWLWIDDFVGKGLSTSIILEFTWYQMVTLVPLALPLARSEEHTAELK